MKPNQPNKNYSALRSNNNNSNILKTTFLLQTERHASLIKNKSNCTFSPRRTSLPTPWNLFPWANKILDIVGSRGGGLRRRRRFSALRIPCSRAGKFTRLRILGGNCTTSETSSPSSNSLARSSLPSSPSAASAYLVCGLRVYRRRNDERTRTTGGTRRRSGKL